MQSSLLNRIRGLPPISMKQNLNQSEGLHISKGQKGWAVEEGCVSKARHIFAGIKQLQHSATHSKCHNCVPGDPKPWCL